MGKKSISYSDIEKGVRMVVVNTQNYPERIQPHVLGEDISGITEKVAIAVSDLLSEQGVEVRCGILKCGCCWCNSCPCADPVEKED